jgi:transposase
MQNSQLKHRRAPEPPRVTACVSYGRYKHLCVFASLLAVPPNWLIYFVLHFYIDIFKRHSIITMMRGATFFTQPVLTWQRRYEALRAFFVDRLPTQLVAERFGFSANYVRLLCHQFRHGKIDLSESFPQGKLTRYKVGSDTRGKIIAWRQQRLSAGEIVELLSEEGVELSVRTVERVLAEEGLPKLPRRTRLKLGLTVRGTQVPERSEALFSIGQVEGQCLESTGAGIFLFAPFIAQIGLHEVVQAAGLPGTKVIAAGNYFLSFLALKLLGSERYAHVGEHAFDPALGLFAGLNVLPKCTALSTYSYSLDEVHLSRLQQTFVQRSSRLGLYDGTTINLDFHTVPHYGEQSVLEEHWAGARGKVMKGALTLFAQDAQTKLLLYTAADIQKEEAHDQVLTFLYSRLAQNLRGFEACDAPKLYRDFVKGKGQVAVKDRQITVTYPRRAHNPILRAVPWQRLPQKVPWLDDAQISFHFQ